MAIDVKPVAGAAQKFVQRAQSASQDYATQAEAKADKWGTNAAAADANFFQAVSQPSTQRRFKAGVVRAGAAKFARGIREKGANRFGPGVVAGQQDYQSAVEPYFATIAALNLPGRRPRGDPANYNRVSAVGNALNAKRIASLGGTA